MVVAFHDFELDAGDVVVGVVFGVLDCLPLRLLPTSFILHTSQQLLLDESVPFIQLLLEVEIFLSPLEIGSNTRHLRRVLVIVLLPPSAPAIILRII